MARLSWLQHPWNAESIEAVQRLAGEWEVSVCERFGAVEADDRVERPTQSLLRAEAVCGSHQVAVRVQQRHQICSKTTCISIVLQYLRVALIFAECSADAINCSLVRAVDCRIVRCGIINSCRSGATSEIVKRFCSRVSHVSSAIASTEYFPLIITSLFLRGTDIRRSMSTKVSNVLTALKSQWALSPQAPCRIMTNPCGCIQYSRPHVAVGSPRINKQTLESTAALQFFCVSIFLLCYFLLYCIAFAFHRPLPNAATCRFCACTE